MRMISRNTRQTASERLSDEEVTIHIIAAYDALNRTLAEASKHSPAYSFNGRNRYQLTLSTNPQHAARGNGTLVDLQEGKCYDIRICFGTTVADVQLRREFFEDGEGSQVFVKPTSCASLMRNFMVCLRDLQVQREPGRWSFGPGETSSLAMSAAS